MKVQVLHSYLKSGVLSFIALSLGLSFSLPTLADYIPSPERKPATDYTRSGGSRRTCPQLIALASQKYVGRTASPRPTFAWFMSVPGQVDFRVFKFNSTGQWQQIGQTIDLSSQKGIVKLTLPEEVPELVAGERYLWQVAIDCPSGDVIDRAEFTLVKIPASLSQELARTTDKAQRADIYAEADLWYEALSEALTSAPESKLSELGANFVRNLAQWEEPQHTESSKRIEPCPLHQKIDALQQIADGSENITTKNCP